jgi:DNA mismatch repair protein MSH2
MVLQKVEDQFRKFTEMVETTIDLEELKNHNYMIKPEFNEELQELAGRISEFLNGMDKEHRSVGHDLNLELDKKLHLENNSTYGYCFRVSKLVCRCSMRGITLKYAII